MWKAIGRVMGGIGARMIRAEQLRRASFSLGGRMTLGLVELSLQLLWWSRHALNIPARWSPCLDLFRIALTMETATGQFSADAELLPICPAGMMNVLVGMP
jgi:hypothetical protein